MKFLAWSILLGGLLGAAPPASAQDGRTGLLTRTVRTDGRSYSYQVYVPAKVKAQANPPVIIFLHGIGQRGEGGFLPTSGPALGIARRYLEQVPAIILLPQCRQGLYWHSPEMERMVMAALDQTVTEFNANSKRLYLTGVSMGGFGAWHLASQQSGKFAALVSICGGSPLTTGDRFGPIAHGIGRTPAWVFHGADDRIVPVSESRQMVAALKEIKGSRVRYNEYPGVGHNVWMKALAEPGLLPWLLEQRLD